MSISIQGDFDGRFKRPFPSGGKCLIKGRGHKFLNNELRTVIDIENGKIIFDKGEIVRNGVPLHIDQGMAVTRQAS
jgi:hypothetical protein